MDVCLRPDIASIQTFGSLYLFFVLYEPSSTFLHFKLPMTNILGCQVVENPFFVLYILLLNNMHWMGFRKGNIILITQEI